MQATLVESGPAPEGSDSPAAGREPAAACPPRGRGTTERPMWRSVGPRRGKGERVAEGFREELVRDSRLGIFRIFQRIFRMETRV